MNINPLFEASAMGSLDRSGSDGSQRSVAREMHHFNSRKERWGVFWLSLILFNRLGQRMLVGGIATHLEKKNIPNIIWKHKECSKPPTSMP